LNEGFATLFQYDLTDIIYPEWRIRDFFNLAAQNTMRSDSAATVRPMTMDVSTLDEINNAFGYISYGKGEKT